MKKLTTFLLTCALCIGIADAQVVKEIGDGTGTNTNTPFVNGADETMSQTLYLAEEIGFGSGSTISAISYNCASVGAYLEDEDVKIYMVNSDLTSLTRAGSNTLPESQMTLVYHNTSYRQPDATGWFTITLDSPFTYNGGSLIVVVKRSGVHTGGNTYMITNTTDTMFVYTTSAGTWPASCPYGNKRRVNTRLTITPMAANMPPEEVTIGSTTTTSATLTLTRNAYSLDPDNFKIEYGLRGFAEGTGTTVMTSDASLTHAISGLTPGKWYDVYVSSMLGGSASASKKHSFHTLPVALNLPYELVQVDGQMVSYSSYKDDNEIPVGWDFPGASSSVPKVWYNYSAPNSRIGMTTNMSTWAIAVLPEFVEDLNSTVLRFTTSNSSLTKYGYWYGGAFVELGSAAEATEVVSMQTIDANIPAGARLAFGVKATSPFGNSTVYISDISVEYVPCPVPTSVTVVGSSITANSFTVNWTGDHNVGDTYKVRLTSGGSDVYVAEGVTEQTFSFNSTHGVDTATSYVVYVGKVCSGLVETAEVGTVGDIRTNYVVRTAVNDANMGVVVGKKTAPYGGDVTLTAVVYPGYNFVRWEVYNTLGVLQTTIADSEIDVTLDDANLRYTYKAVFAANVYTVSTQDDGHGTVSIVSANVAYGETADLTATPALGYHFDYWEKDGVRVNGDAHITPVVYGDATYKAYFAQNIYNVSISATEGGLIVGGSIARTATHGENIVAEAATTNAGLYAFSQWSDGITDNPRTFVVEDNINVVAQFVSPGAYVISGVADPVVGGAIEYGNGTGNYLPAEVAIIRAVPNANYRFVNWTWAGGSSTSQEYRTNLSANLNMTAHFELVEHRVSIAASANGHATGAGIYTHGTGATLTAYPNAGYQLVNWTVDGMPTSGEGNVLNIAAVNADMDITPNFAINTYTVTLSGENVTLGGAGTYGYNEEVTITATPAAHYDFLRWSNGDLRQSYSFRISEDVTLTAVTGQHDYTVSGLSADAAMGSVTGSTTAHSGQVVNLTAVPNEHYVFTAWDNSSTANPLSVTVTGDVTRVASFAPVHYHVTLVQPAVADGTIALTAGDSAAAVYGTELTYTVNLQPGKRFVRWTDGSTQNPRTLVVHDNTSLEAEIDDEEYNVTVTSNNPLYGSVTGTGTYGWQDVVTPTATVSNESLYQFISWSDGESSATHSTIVVENDINLTAIFGERNAFTIALLSNDNTMGSATATAYTAHDGDNVTITATPNANYHFVQWSDGNNNAVRMLTVHNNTVLTAIFAIDTYTLTLNNGTNGSVTGASTGLVNYGSNVTFIAQPAQNYHFVYWMDENGDSVAVANPLTVTITGDATYTPLFAKNQYEITTDIAIGTVSGAGTYEYGTPVTLTATLPSNYDFLGWSINGVAQPGNDKTLSFTITENAYVKASVAKHQYQLAVSSNSNAMGYITGDANGGYDFDQSFSVTAVPTNAAQYQFVNWNNDNNMTSAVVDSNFSAGDVTMVAYFSVRSYTLGVGTEGDGQVTAVSGSHPYGTLVTVEATPGTGMAFSHWSDDFSNTNPRTVQVTGDMSFNAVFVPASYTLTLVSNDLAKGEVAVDSNLAASYTYGQRVKILAHTLNSDLYKFIQWQDGVTDSIRTITMTDNVEYTAFFGMANMFSVVVLGSEGGGAIASSTSVYNNTQVTIDTANVLPHYHFIGWYNADGDLVYSEPTQVITVNADVLLSARYALDRHDIVLNAEGCGTVSGAGSYDWGSTANIYAEACSHYRFVKWSDDITANPRNIVLDGDTSLTAVFELKTYTLTVNGENTQVTGGGNYTAMSNATLTAVADDDYTFSHWTKNGSLFTVASDTTFVVEESAEYVAISTENARYRVTTMSANLSQGFADVDGNITSLYYMNNTATVTATPADHHHFAYWVVAETGDTVEANPYSFNVTEDITLAAYFAVDSFDVIFRNYANGSLAGEGSYAWNSPVTVVATADQHYDFVRWSDTLGTPLSSNATYTFNMPEGGIVLDAEFGLHTYTVTASATNGTILRGSGSFPAFTSDTIVAIANENYHLIGWQVNGLNVVANSDTLIIASVEDDCNVVALYGINGNSFAFSVNDADMGDVVATVDGVYTMGGMFDNGSEVVLIARKRGHNEFVGWFNANDATFLDTISLQDTLHFALTKDTNIIALFEPHMYNVVAALDTTVNADSVMGYTTGSGRYGWQSLATVTAVANDGYHFSHWNDGVTTETRQIYVTGDTTVTAYFVMNDHTVTVQINDTSMGYVTGAGLFGHGDTVTLRAYPKVHCQFVGFNGANDNIDSVSFVVTSDTTVTATFSHIFLDLFTSVTNGTMSVDIEGNPANVQVQPIKAKYNDSITLTVTPDSHYHLAYWVVNTIRFDTVVSTTLIVDSTWLDSSYVDIDGIEHEIWDSLYHFETVVNINRIVSHVGTYTDNPIGMRITEHTEVHAECIMGYYNVTVQGEYVNVYGDGQYHYGDIVTLRATGLDHHHFVAWLNADGDTLSTENPWSFRVEGDTTIYAATALDIMHLSVSASHGGTVQGSGDYGYGSPATITAIPDSGYSFIRWDDGDTNAVRVVYVYENLHFYAIFSHVGIDDADVSNVQVYAAEHSIIVRGAAQKSIRVFDAVGRQVVSTRAADDMVRLTMEGAGVYMVQVGNGHVHRVILLQ